MTRATETDAERAGRNVSDGAGMILLGLCALWALITAAVHDGRPEGMLLAVLAAAAGCATGRISGALLPVAAPGAGAAVGLVLAVTMPALLPGPPYAVPLGHTGATAALLALATGAACCAARATPVPALRSALWLLAVLIVLTGVVTGSPVGCVASGAVLLCSLAAGSMPHRGVGVAGLALAAAGAAGGVWAVAAGVLPGGLVEAVTDRLGPYRVHLWQDALELAGRAPVSGVGPGLYGQPGGAAPGVPAEVKPHSAPLQLLAEQGLVGVLLLAAVYCWVLHALWRAPRPTPVVLTAGAALTVLAVLASLGNVLSFTTVTAGAGLLAGWATARPWVDEERMAREEVVAGERTSI
ncbi:O-antigen ligase family protein [Streptomyces sp. DSM 110735]|uniref:O-antigen ligase family protein n=1 Tax=Streptomyces sp. DSM 110735 TaxID=2775031 RepID=UPI0018F4AE39|nr:O-antigen ligase family protein [Streptomyces sp. DSM 110735]MBJ7902262.1 O-antigen ligase family protein [Streptomyces sp. DSM 110735]